MPYQLIVIVCCMLNHDYISNKQMIKVSTGTIPDSKGLREQIKQRRAASSAPDVHAPRMYAQDAWNNNSSTDKIPQSGNNVNPANEYSPEYQNGAQAENIGAQSENVRA